MVAQLVNNPPAIWETWVRSLSWEDPLEKGKATHSSILAWRIPWTVIVHGVTKSQTWLSDFHFHFFKHSNKNEDFFLSSYNSAEQFFPGSSLAWSSLQVDKDPVSWGGNREWEIKPSAWKWVSERVGSSNKMFLNNFEGSDTWRPPAVLSELTWWQTCWCPPSPQGPRTRTDHRVRSREFSMRA